jgi:hypothetical protein
MARSFPFRFYGVAPRDWFEGANLGHLYELQFVTAPSATARRAIAAAFEAAAFASPVDVDADPWRWSGAWVVLFVGERAAGDARGTFAAMGELCKAIHAVAPLAQVVFHGARERGTTGWDAWSVKQQDPTPGPAWPGLDTSMGAYGTERAARKVSVSTDKAFEAARVAARNKLRLANRPKTGLVAVKKAPVPRAAPRAHEKLFPDRADVFVVNGRTFGLAGNYNDKHVAWVEGTKLKRVKLPWFEALGVHRDGGRLLYASNKMVYEVTLPSTKSTPVLDCGQTLAGLAYGPGDTILAMTAEYLGLFARTPRGLVNLVTRKVSGSGLHSFRDGSVVVVRTHDERVVVYDCTPSSLVERARYKQDSFTAYEVDGRIFVEDTAGVCELQEAPAKTKKRAKNVRL